jgi:tol-pal system protein YbgF
MSSLRADNRRLTQNVDELRADRRAQDRKIKDLEHQLAIAKSSQTSPDVPQLPVEVMAPAHAAPAAPGDPRVVAVEEDGTQIVYEGDAALGKSAAVDDESLAAMTPMHTRDRIEVTQRIPPISARASHRALRGDAIVHDSVPANDAAANDYRSAVELVKSGKHDEAVTALRAFLKAYPRHDYADNAQYWLGEAYYVTHDYKAAAGAFRTVLDKWPDSRKAPDALLKLGYTQSAQKQYTAARATLNEVMRKYPGSEPAKLAGERLSRLAGGSAQ